MTLTRPDADVSVEAARTLSSLFFPLAAGGYVDPAQEVLDEVNGVIASARERIAAFSPTGGAVCARLLQRLFLLRDATVLFRRWSDGNW